MKIAILLIFLFWESLFNSKNKEIKKELNIPVVIMAGGKGTRLEPFTKVLPKPLVPIQDRPIIEHIIDRFTSIGCKSFNITLNYKERIIKAYFEELEKDYKVNFFKEDHPLGTGGSLHLLKDIFDKSFFVTNCDVIIKADYSSLYDFHLKNDFDVTIVASAKQYIIPYGSCELSQMDPYHILTKSQSMIF